MRFKLFFIVIFIQIAQLSFGEIKVASVLGDNMVLQRNTEVKLWGKALPNEKLTIKTEWNNASVATKCNEKGDWLLKVKTTEAGGPYTITIASKNEKFILNNILLGEVWFCSGQSNMAMSVSGGPDQPVNGSTDMLLNAADNNIRLFKCKNAYAPVPLDSCSGKWEVSSAETVEKFSVIGYLFAKQIQQALKVPMGIISSSWGGSRIEAWMNRETLNNFPDALKQTKQPDIQPNKKASYLYNGMINPFININFKGVLWYQGESNIVNYYDYAALFSTMVNGWRKDFGIGNFPFYFIQIAPYNYKNSKSVSSALQRDEQFKSMSLIPNSGMVSTIDIGEENCIHPAEKATVAKRLALWALSETYGFKGLPYKSPSFNKMEINDSIATISFNNAENGLSTFGQEVGCFEIAGTDSLFYPANMKISQKKVRIWSPNVKSPVAVRYAFSNFPKTTGYLYNTAKLPVIPFRTDDWGR